MPLDHLVTAKVQVTFPSVDLLSLDLALAAHYPDRRKHCSSLWDLGAENRRVDSSLDLARNLLLHPLNKFHFVWCLHCLMVIKCIQIRSRSISK